MTVTIHRSTAAGLALLAAFAASAAAAQERPDDFPTRPINLVVMYPAGGAVDTTARTFAQVAEQQLDISLRVENRVGGAGMVGHTSLATTTAPDGYTIGVIANPFLYTDMLLRDAPFAPDAFEPIAGISFDPVVWTINANSAIGEMSFAEIMEHAQENRLQVGMNPDSVFLFVSEFIELAQDVDFNFIPFDGGRAGVVSLLAGDIDATAAFYSEIAQYIEAGDLRAVAVSGDSPHPLMPDVPTLSDLGVPVGGLTWGVTRYFTVPPGMDAERKDWLASAFHEVLQSPEMAEAFTQAGLTLNPTDADEMREMYAQGYEALREFLMETDRIAD